MRDILAIRAGERERLAGLVQRHGPRVHDLARRLLKDAHLAEDVAQHAFANAWRALPRFDLERPFRHWILRITTNLCRNLHASRRARPEQALPSDEEGATYDPPGGAPDPASAAAEGTVDTPGPPLRAAHVREAIERLPERYRLPVVLFHLYGLALEEVAEITEVPVPTVKTHLFRGRALLKELLRPPETAPGPGGTAPRPSEPPQQAPL